MMIEWRMPTRILFAAAAWAIASTSPWAGTIEGTATYRERIALPPDAIFEALLQDVSLADAPSTMIARARLDPAGQPPFRFKISYDDAAIKAGRRYAVRAIVKQRGHLLFTTDQAYPFSAGQTKPLEILLVSTRGGRKIMRGAQKDASPGPLAVADHDGAVLTGLFQYGADAAAITLCADGRTLPVAMEGDYRALESAYLETRQESSETAVPATLVALQGIVTARPSAEESQPPRATLVVERFIDIKPGETCLVAMNDSPLRNTYWKLVRLNGRPVEAAERQREPHLIFASHELRISGSGGCNRITGSITLDGNKLRFGQMASTRMACVSGMEQEDRFLRSLSTIERYKINGSHLTLLDKSGAAVAEFDAVALL